MTDLATAAPPQHPRIVVVVYPDGRGSVRIDNQTHPVHGVSLKDGKHKATQLVRMHAAEPLQRVVRVDTYGPNDSAQILVSPDGTVTNAPRGSAPTTITPATPTTVTPIDLGGAATGRAGTALSPGQLAIAGGALLAAAGVVVAAGAHQPRRDATIDLAAANLTVNPTSAATPPASPTAAPTVAAAAATAAPAGAASPTASSTTPPPGLSAPPKPPAVTPAASAATVATPSAPSSPSSTAAPSPASGQGATAPAIRATVQIDASGPVTALLTVEADGQVSLQPLPSTTPTAAPSISVVDHTSPATTAPASGQVQTQVQTQGQAQTTPTAAPVLTSASAPPAPTAAAATTSTPHQNPTAAPTPTAAVASGTTGTGVNLAEVNRVLTALNQAIANAQAVLSSAAATPLQGSTSTAAPTPSQEPAASADALGSPEEEAELNEAAKAATLAIIESNAAGAQPAPAPSASTATTTPTAAPTPFQGAQPAALTATPQATAAAPQPAATSASAAPTSPAPTATSRPTPTAAASPTGAGTAERTPSSPATPAATSGTETSAAGALEVQPAPVSVPDDEISQQDNRTTTSASPSGQTSGQRTDTAAAQPQDASTPATTPTAAAGVSADGGGWLSGAAGDGVTDGALGDWRGKPLQISGTWQDSGDSQTQMWNLAPGAEFGDWDKPLDLAPGGFNDGDSWSAAASGAYDDRWREGLTKAAQYRAGKGTTYIRPFHELNGNWYPWSVAPGQEQDFITAWKRYRAIQQQVFPDAKLVFNVNVNSVGGLDWRKAWPGAGQADVLGVDIYNGSPHRYESAEAWNSSLDATGDDGIPIGLNAYAAQAKEWGVPLAVPEWSGRAEEGDDPAFITGIGEWFAAHAGTGPGQLLYEVMFNVDRNEDNFRLFQGTRMPQSAQAYREAFSKPASSGAGATTFATASRVAATPGQAGADQRSQDSDEAAQASTKTGAGAPDSADQRATAAGDASESGDVGDPAGSGGSGGSGDVNATAGFENRHDGSTDPA